jgi:hypothetical protein
MPHLCTTPEHQKVPRLYPQGDDYWQNIHKCDIIDTDCGFLENIYTYVIGVERIDKWIKST